MSKKPRKSPRVKKTNDTKSAKNNAALYAKAARHYRAGNLSRAEKTCCKILARDSHHIDAHNLLAIIYGRSEKPGKAVAVLQTLLRLCPDHAEAHSNLGFALSLSGRVDEAISSYQEAIRIKPTLPNAHFNLANALRTLDRLDEAEVSYRETIRLDPGHAEAHNNLATTLKDRDRLEEALDHCRRAIRLQPDFHDAHYNSGLLLKRLGRLEEAELSYRQAISFKPDSSAAHNNLGTVLNDLHRLEEAAAAYRRAIELKPDYAEAHYHLSTITQYRPGDGQIDHMETLHSNSSLSDTERIPICFALSKAHDDLGNVDSSFSYLDEGNKLCRKERKYDIENDRRLFIAIKRIFDTEEMIALQRQAEGPSITPVFIVGMPRSGTSLVEQILATHPMVHGAGELTAFGRIMASLLPRHSESKAGACVRESFRDVLTTLRGDYLEALAGLDVPERVITDKMPENFRWIGWMISAFPEAKIVHLNRDPVATCYSIYRNRFSTDGIAYAYGMEDLAKYYRLYVDLMAFWRSRFPNRIHDVSYEYLTEHQEKVTRELLDFCELPWDERCLDFHETQRAVTTASANQVRRKMYRGSSEAWKRYEKHLRPLIESLHDDHGGVRRHET